jgi:hypothetical protein
MLAAVEEAEAVVNAGIAERMDANQRVAPICLHRSLEASISDHLVRNNLRP